jgi:hypothetical protein
MSDLESNQNPLFTAPDEKPAIDEKTVLLERAKTMGLKVSGNIGLDTLREKVKAAIEGRPEASDDSDEPAATDAPMKETRAQMVERIQKEAMKLIRVRITCMNPAKTEYTGEFFCVANRFIGEVKKFIPYGNGFTDNGYHIPHVLYEEMKSRKFTQIKTQRRNGIDVIVPEELREVPEFSIEVLPPLTVEELNDLKIQQAQSGSTL